jgi:hypothetical protein
LNASALSIELARNADAAMCLVAVGYVVFDSFSKRVDVASLKKELDLRRGQLISKVIGDLEKILGPSLAAGRPSYDFEDGEVSPPLAILDESTRNALTEAIKQNEVYFFEIRLVRRLPREIQALNTLIFWLVMGVAVVSGLCLCNLLFWSVSPSILWIHLLMPSVVVIATAVAAGLRHLKVQNAEKQILKNDSQA